MLIDCATLFRSPSSVLEGRHQLCFSLYLAPQCSLLSFVSLISSTFLRPGPLVPPRGTGARLGRALYVAIGSPVRKCSGSRFGNSPDHFDPQSRRRKLTSFHAQLVKRRLSSCVRVTLIGLVQFQSYLGNEVTSTSFFRLLGFGIGIVGILGFWRI